MNTPLPTDPATAALEAALPELRSIRRTGWMISVASVAAAIAILFYIKGIEDNTGWIIGALMVGIFGVMQAFSWVRGRHERAVMPIIAQAFGLSYQKSPSYFFDGLPKNFIPLGGSRSVDDMMEGRIADRAFRFAECKTETGGDDSSTLFKGVVLEVKSAGTLPQFIIASEKETRGFLFFKGRVQVDGMMLVHQSTGQDGQTYGLWSHSETAGQMVGMRAFMEKIIELGPRVLGSSSLYSLNSTGGQYFVSIRHSRDLFRIGGLLSKDADVMRDIRTASSEFSQPIQLVSEILKAEQALLAAT